MIENMNEKPPIILLANENDYHELNMISKVILKVKN